MPHDPCYTPSSIAVGHKYLATVCITWGNEKKHQMSFSDLLDQEEKAGNSIIASGKVEVKLTLDATISLIPTCPL